MASPKAKTSSSCRLLCLSTLSVEMASPRMQIRSLSSIATPWKQFRIPRLQRLKKKILSYIFATVCHEGKQHCICNALSRATVSWPMPEDETECEVRQTATCNAIKTVDESSPPTKSNRSIQELQASTGEDLAYGRLLTCVSSRFPSNRFGLHSSVLPYWKKRESLYTDGELVLVTVCLPASMTTITG
ncbi:hypothetical protein SK128_010830 [Halocaridina rubra]|uniref:Uncharacterized protein n=1 Tax=Halocaridina rubra TaxID=373956 RepID=A0AAN8XR22_HALRR